MQSPLIHPFDTFVNKLYYIFKVSIFSSTEYNVVHVGMFRTEYHVVQFRLAGGNKYALAVLDDIGQFIGKGEFGEQ